MEYVKETLDNPVGIAMSVAVAIMAFRWVYGVIKEHKEYLLAKHRELSEEEKKDESLQNVTNISELHTQSLLKIDESLGDINKRMSSLENSLNDGFKNVEEKREKTLRINGRASLYHLYEVLKDKDELSLSEYETFDELATEYLKAGGNGAFKNKIIPEIREKKINHNV